MFSYAQGTRTQWKRAGMGQVHFQEKSFGSFYRTQRRLIDEGAVREYRRWKFSVNWRCSCVVIAMAVIKIHWNQWLSANWIAYERNVSSCNETQVDSFLSATIIEPSRRLLLSELNSGYRKMWKFTIMLLETPEKFHLALTKSCSDNSQRCLEMKYRRVPYKHRQDQCFSCDILCAYNSNNNKT